VLVKVWTPSENEKDVGEMAISGKILFPRGVARSKEPVMRSLCVYGLNTGIMKGVVKKLPVYE
jgi:hypothetical protein